MKVMDSIDGMTGAFERPVIAVGNFDGVHIGHRDIIETAVERARAVEKPCVIVTFEPHPQLVIGNHTAFPILTPLEEKLRLLSTFPIDGVAVLPFTIEFAHTEPEEYIRQIYVEKMQVSEIVVGYSHAFGRFGKGNVKLLEHEGTRYGFRVHVIPPMCIGDTPVTSSQIRKLILDGQTKKAEALLGHPYILTGFVIHGAGRGRQLDFPTANIDFRMPHVLLPRRGVYAIRVKLGDVWRPGVMNLGIRPTFGTGRESVEIHILDFDGDIYGEELGLEIIERLRDEIRFPSVDDLKAQIIIDVEKTRELFS